MALETIITLFYNKVKRLRGFLPALAVNEVFGDAKGLMIAGLGNYIERDVFGILIDGLGNKVEGDFKGLAFGGVNYLWSLNGIQIGILNYAEKTNGFYLQVGIVNYVDGKRRFLFNYIT